MSRASCPKCGAAPAEHFMYAKMMRFGSADPGPLYDLARGHARQGMKDRAFAELEEALRAGYADRANLEREPDWAALRADPRFAALLERYLKT